ncbi:unnamed protein product [Tilletia controversa]|nr:unnamed protein product [Tilletia controversa]
MAPSFVSNSLPDANELLGMTIQTLIQLAQKTSPSEAVIDCARIIKAAQKSPLDNIIPNIGNVAYANKVQRPIKTATAPATSPSRIDSKTEVDEDKTPRATTRPAAPIVRRAPTTTLSAAHWQCPHGNCLERFDTLSGLSGRKTVSAKQEGFYWDAIDQVAHPFHAVDPTHLPHSLGHAFADIFIPVFNTGAYGDASARVPPSSSAKPVAIDLNHVADTNEK